MCFIEEDRKGLQGYFLKFDSPKDGKTFLNQIGHVSSVVSLLHSASDDTISLASGIEKTPTKTLPTNSPLPQQSQWCAAEYSKLIIYCQGVKLKELDINKAQDLLGRKFDDDYRWEFFGLLFLVKIKSFKEMISLNYVKADTFCRDLEAMIQ